MRIHPLIANLIVSSLLIIATQRAAAQLPRDRNAAIDDLVSRAENWDYSAILELGRRRASGAEKQLRELAAQGAAKAPRRSIKKERAAYAAKLALARLGEEAFFTEIVAGLKNRDTTRRRDSIDALGYVGDKRAISSLGPMLFDDGGAEQITDESFSDPFSMIAAKSLGRILPDVLAGFEMSTGKGKHGDYRPEWRAWWRKEGSINYKGE